MVVGVIVNLIVFPPGLIATFLFKNTKPIKTRANRYDLGLEKGYSAYFICIHANNIFSILL
jgi:hypothetical protein